MDKLKIMITGGNSGIGLEINKQLSHNNKVNSFSRENGFDLKNDESIWKIINLIKEEKPDYLFLNSGIANFRSFSEISFKEIKEIFDVNLIANIKIISSIKTEIKNGTKIVVTLSTASFINGAYEAVYNASKKALKEYIISVNTELINDNIDNLIFMFVPHKIIGTKISGNKNFPTKGLSDIIKNLIESIEKNEDIFIPKFKEVYKDVFDEYKESPYLQGSKSIEYKKKRGENE